MKITRIIKDDGFCCACRDDVHSDINIVFLNLFKGFAITTELCDGHLKDLKEYIKKTIPRNVRFKTKDGFVSFKVRD